MNRHLHQFPETERNLVPTEQVDQLLRDSLSEWVKKPSIINKWVDIASKKLGKNIEANDLLTIYKEGWIREALEPFKQSEVWSFQNEIMRGMKTAENSVAIYLHANREILVQNRPEKKPTSLERTTTPKEGLEKGEGKQGLEKTKETKFQPAQDQSYKRPQQEQRPKEGEQTPSAEEWKKKEETTKPTQSKKLPVEHLHQHPVEQAPAKGQISKATPERAQEEHPGTGIKGREGPKADEENLNVPTESLQQRDDFPTSTSKPEETPTPSQHPSDVSKEPSKQPDDLRTMEATHFENEPPLDLNKERLQPTELSRAREQASSDVKDLLERQETPQNLF